ncbi:hypothetical protein ACELLULO517_19525 [Acidisoma cellulosilytica]|uniref:Glycosyltransferase n=1 Tax=Acidisoma cellulosilyticum TaxID=2802395 RepID=A0A963Z478_9PROT|nr:hypothetical protein [Acidisoma cellulosilyticum]MCB8882448.1 hypothetical protein [Acidisoma cellulosilyticum]
MKIAFLYNHDAVHQIPHTIPVASALAARGVDVHVLTSSAEQRETAASLIAPGVAAPGTAVTFHDLTLSWPNRLADHLLRPVLPFKRIAILREHATLLGSFDAIVVPETTTTLLRTRFGVSAPKLIYIPHGAGDGAAGFRKTTRHFDLVLLSGEKVRDRMLSGGLITPDNHAIIGYPKFDIALGRPVERFFDNDLPTVVYNPHFNPHISSFYPFGRAVLDWFAQQDRFNLIFAPHTMLFKRAIHITPIHKRIGWRGNLPKTLLDHPRIRIDTGSRRSVDMSYTRAADIYLGDVSSQIYEWIAQPRPAIFFNTGGEDRATSPDFGHWSLGEVITRVDALPAALDRAITNPDAFKTAQELRRDLTFSMTETPAGERGAEAILAFMARSASATG